MTTDEREAIRTQALETLRSIRAEIGARPNMNLDALIEREARRADPRAEITVFIVISRVFVKHGLDWMDIFEPISRFDGAELRAIFDASEAILRKA